jgi:hypothetical protein
MGKATKLHEAAQRGESKELQQLLNTSLQFISFIDIICSCVKKPLKLLALSWETITS